MGVLAQQSQQGSRIRLKTLAHAVELIAPKAGGVDQQQRLEGKRQAHHSPPPAAPSAGSPRLGLTRHRNSASRCRRNRRSSPPARGQQTSPGPSTLGGDGCLHMPPPPHQRSSGFQTPLPDAFEPTKQTAWATASEAPPLLQRLAPLGRRPAGHCAGRTSAKPRQQSAAA